MTLPSVGVLEDWLSPDWYKESCVSLKSGGDMSITSPEMLEVISKSRSVEQSATNNKLCVLDGETVALKYKVRLHFDA